MKNKSNHPVGFSGRTIGKLIQAFKPIGSTKGPHAAKGKK